METHAENSEQLQAETLENQNQFIEDDDGGEDFATLLDELDAGQDATLNVYRVRAGKKLSFVFSCSPSDYTLGELMEKLRDEFDGGEFRVHIRDRKRLLANRAVAVEPPKRKPQREMPQQENQQNGLAQVLAAIHESNKQSAENMQMLMLKNAEQNNSLMADILKSSISKPSSKGMELLELLPLIKELFGDKKTDPMREFLKGLELGKELGGGGDENLLQTALKTFGAPLVDLARSAENRMVRLPNNSSNVQHEKTERTHMAAAPAQEVASEEQQQQAAFDQMSEEDKTMYLQLMKLQSQIGMLINAAAQNSDVESYANMICDQVQPEVIANMLSPENWEKFFKFVPMAAQYRQWFEELKETVLDFIAQDQENVSRETLNGNGGASVPKSNDNTGGNVPNASEPVPHTGEKPN